MQPEIDSKFEASKTRQELFQPKYYFNIEGSRGKKKFLYFGKSWNHISHLFIGSTVGQKTHKYGVCVGFLDTFVQSLLWVMRWLYDFYGTCWYNFLPVLRVEQISMYSLLWISVLSRFHKFYQEPQNVFRISDEDILCLKRISMDLFFICSHLC